MSGDDAGLSENMPSSADTASFCQIIVPFSTSPFSIKKVSALFLAKTIPGYERQGQNLSVLRPNQLVG
jgi:hypothetical protein